MFLDQVFVFFSLGFYIVTLSGERLYSFRYVSDEAALVKLSEVFYSTHRSSIGISDS